MANKRPIKIKPKWDMFLRIAVVLLILTVAGPEIGIGIEMLALLDGLGAELFLLSMTLGVWMPFRLFLAKLKGFAEWVDPYFFIPSRRQVLECPGMIVHCIPGFMLCVVVLYELKQPIIDS